MRNDHCSFHQRTLLI